VALLAKLEYVHKNLSVAYRSSLERQRIDIQMTSSEMSSAYVQMLALVRHINSGAASGSEFPPESSFAKIIRDTPDKNGPNYDWQLEIAGMSPKFIRQFVERLRGVSRKGYAMSLAIRGSFALDESPLSVTEREVIAWLDDPNAYPGAWPSPGFPVEREFPPKGASVRVRLAGKANKKILSGFRNVLAIWSNLTLEFFDAKGEQMGRSDFNPSIAASGVELSARYGIFDRVREPSAAALINLLGRLHHDVAPIEKAIIAL
jgi:hypothetical protein